VCSPVRLLSSGVSREQSMLFNKTTLAGTASQLR